VSAANHPPATNCLIPRGFAILSWPRSLAEGGLPKWQAVVLHRPCDLADTNLPKLQVDASTFFADRLKIWPTPVSQSGKSPTSRLDRPSRVGELSASCARLLPTQVCMVGWMRAHARWSLSCEKIGKDASVQAH
jgi:hypothetical protein